MKKERSAKGLYREARKEINRINENNIAKLRKAGKYNRWLARKVRFKHYINAYEKRMIHECAKGKSADEILGRFL